MPRSSKNNEAAQLWHPRLWPSWAIVFVLYMLSFLSMSSKQRLGGRLGRFLNRKLKSRARVADRNLEICLPELDEAARKKLVQDNFIACSRGFLESTHAWWRDVSPYYEAAEVQGLEHLREAQSRGKGVLLIGPDLYKEIYLDKDCNFSAEMGYRGSLGRYYKGALLLRDHDEHRFQRRMMQSAFKNDAMKIYIDTMGPMIGRAVASWGNTPEMKFFPAIKQNLLDVAARIFVGLDEGDEPR